jgi:hypothetical protein
VVSTAALAVAMVVPPRVLLVGDSITGQYAPTAAASIRHHGYDVVVRAYPGVGLLDRGPRVDLPAHLAADLRSHPSVVVAEFSGNYGIADPPQPGVPLGSPQFLVQWGREARAFTRNALGDGARVAWLLAPPPLRGDTSVSDELRALYRQEVSHGVSVLDPASPVSAYDVNGSLYAPDGRHLSAAGAKLVASLVAHDVESESRWAVRLHSLARSALAVTGAVIAVAGTVAAVAFRPRRRAPRSHRSSAPLGAAR